MGAQVIVHADALDWLRMRRHDEATIVVFDPPYAVGTPVRGREDGAAGSVFGPVSFLHQTLSMASAALRPGGIVMIFADWRRVPDVGYIASTVGLRLSAQLAWIRRRPGTGGLFRASWDPILIASRGTPDAIDRSAKRNVIETDETCVEADYDFKRTHPYGKPAKVFEYVFSRLARPGDLVLDPFAGSGVSRDVALKLGMRWAGCDIDPVYADRREATA